MTGDELKALHARVRRDARRRADEDTQALCDAFTLLVVSAARDRAAMEREPLTPGTPAHTALCHALATVIADISECEYRAGWYDGIEYDLWSIIHLEPHVSGCTIRGHTEGDHLATLRALSALVGGWVVWQDAAPQWRYATTAEMEANDAD